jgi:hypothetical protein
MLNYDHVVSYDVSLMDVACKPCRIRMCNPVFYLSVVLCHITTSQHYTIIIIEFIPCSLMLHTNTHTDTFHYLLPDQNTVTAGGLKGVLHSDAYFEEITKSGSCL